MGAWSRSTVVVFVVSAASASGATAAPRATALRCPLAVQAAVQWAFSVGANGYTHGRGTVAAPSATGTICEQESAGSHAAAHLVLKVGGRGASLARGITVGGILGARLVLPVSVTATDQAACRVGTHGRVTIFSSYNGAGRDSVRLSFAAGCRVRNGAFSGRTVHVSLPR